MLCEAGNFLYIHADDEHNRLRAYVHNQMRVCIDLSLSLSLSHSLSLCACVKAAGAVHSTSTLERRATCRA